VFVSSAQAASITIGTYTFSGPEAFPTDATYVSGDTTYIEHPPGTSWNSVAGNSTTDLAAALTGDNLIFGVGGESIVVDLTFGGARILNLAGNDLVIFETVFEEDFDLAVYAEDVLSGPQTYFSVSTGFTVGDIVGTTNTANLNAVEIDLSDFGIGLGEAVSKFRLYTQPVAVPPEDSTAGADIVVVGALNFTPVPIPATVYLFASALGILGWVRRRTFPCDS
jgi:hypothetical protein